MVKNKFKIFLYAEKILADITNIYSNFNNFLIIVSSMVRFLDTLYLTFL